MTEPGDGSRRIRVGRDGRPPVHVDATVAGGDAHRSGAWVDSTATGRDERVPGGSLWNPSAVDLPRENGMSRRCDRSPAGLASGNGEVSAERGVTILHVDDDPDVGPLVSHFLEDVVEHATVVTETDSAAALDRVARVDVDCVVSDLEMPGRDGLDLAMGIDATHPHVPVVLFTSRDWQTVAGETGSEHVSAYVSKEGGHRQFERLARRVRSLLT